MDPHTATNTQVRNIRKKPRSWADAEQEGALEDEPVHRHQDLKSEWDQRNIEASIIRIGFRRPVYYIFIIWNPPPNSIGNYLGSFSIEPYFQSLLEPFKEAFKGTLSPELFRAL